MPAVDLEDPLRHVVQEVPIVGDGEHRTRVRLEVAFQPLHRLRVQVVGRLVEQQQVGLLQQQLAQRDAAALAAGKDVDHRVRRRATERVHRLLELGVDVPGVAVVELGLHIAHLGHQRVEVGVGLAHRDPELVHPGLQRLDVGDRLLDVLQDGLALGQRRLLQQDADLASLASIASPLFGFSIPAISLSSVDLPVPLGPTTPILAPG